MEVKVPKEWEALWATFDQAMLILNNSVLGVSCADVSAVMRIGLGVSATRSPAWCAWAAVRHNATGYEKLRDLAVLGPAGRAKK